MSKHNVKLGTNFSKVQNILSLNSFVLHIFICCQCTALEQKLKKLTEDLSCQRQNAESARCSLEQKLKEKEKEFQEVRWIDSLGVCRDVTSPSLEKSRLSSFGCSREMLSVGKEVVAFSFSLFSLPVFDQRRNSVVRNVLLYPYFQVSLRLLF